MLERFAKATYVLAYGIVCMAKLDVIRLRSRCFKPSPHLAAGYEAGLLKDGLAVSEHHEVWNTLYAETRG